MSKLAYQYRLKLNRTQEKILTKLLSIACRLYNDALDERKSAWEKEKRTVTYLDQAKKLKDLRKTDKELILLNYCAAQHVLRRLDRAFQRFFEAVKSDQKVSYPRFKKPHRFCTLQFTYADGAKLKPDDSRRLRLYIQKVDMIKVVWHCPLPEQSVTKQVWISRKADGWFVSFALEACDETLCNLCHQQEGLLASMLELRTCWHFPAASL
ncbi:MAG: RNA-guided endonuclease InsQ/TnpB family protein [Thermotoga caldifontis]|uniref:RNA-guided endonuclease InsQ/TnpB family protein n=1 Tax=Thermotoga caldifontis TaxID=1508419 RepID=UPI003C79A79D